MIHALTSEWCHAVIRPPLVRKKLRAIRSNNNCEQSSVWMIPNFGIQQKFGIIKCVRKNRWNAIIGMLSTCFTSRRQAVLRTLQFNRTIGHKATEIKRNPAGFSYLIKFSKFSLVNLVNSINNFWVLKVLLRLNHSTLVESTMLIASLCSLKLRV